MNRRFYLALALASIVTAGCSKDNGSSGPSGGKAGNQKVKLVLNWVPEPEFGGFYAARDTGAYTKENLDVDIMGGGAGVPVVQMVAAGQADLALRAGMKS
jgi:NitT/TauT family transport system substrate-binding protein